MEFGRAPNWTGILRVVCTVFESGQVANAWRIESLPVLFAFRFQNGFGCMKVLLDLNPFPGRNAEFWGFFKANFVKTGFGYREPVLSQFFNDALEFVGSFVC
ncbi:MAG: hypothetical protein HY917_05780 [Candidatus Diapherotrites archaeon]|nr:hypothetical protein [Candidatus Diapherotrites archaeon]